MGSSTLSRSGCVLAIEVKKFFMSEWTHQPDLVKMEAVHQALRSTVPGILEELQYLEKIGLKFLDKVSQQYSKLD